jgi:prenyltransferase beta subunit
MAFLARGHVPGQGPYGDVLYKSIDYVIATQKETGLLSAASNNAVMYEHGISTSMLGEVYGMVDDVRRDKIDKVLAKSVKLILDAQKVPQGAHQGGWRYSPTAADADISCTGWQLMALRGAANCGAAVPKKVLDEGVAYVKRNAVASGGFSYQPGGAANQARTGTGILSMEMLGQHHSPEALKGGDYLIANTPDNPGMEFYYYAVYYCSQALNQLGGKYWDTVYPKLRESLLKLQQPSGNWGGGGGQEAEAGDAYRTSMAILALCVPYRYLPLYQK